MRRLLLTSLLIGCSVPQVPVAPAPVDEPSAVDAIDAPGSLAHLYDADGRPIARADDDDAADPPPKSFEPQRIGHHAAPTTPRTRRAGLHNVHLRGARLDNALQTLAKLSGYGVVIESEMPTLIDLELEAVEPFDALLALAEAHDVDISRRGDVLVIRPAASRPATDATP